jgi:hypothetical protein
MEHYPRVNETINMVDAVDAPRDLSTLGYAEGHFDDGPGSFRITIQHSLNRDDMPKLRHFVAQGIDIEITL